MNCSCCHKSLGQDLKFCENCGAMVMAPNAGTQRPSHAKQWIVIGFGGMAALVLAAGTLARFGSHTKEPDATNAKTVEVTSEPKRTARVSQACLLYDPAVVKLRGTITNRVFPGPPNYAKGDEPEYVWILNVAVPLCTKEDKSDEYNQPETNISKLELLLGDKDYDRYRPMVGKAVNVSGSLSHAEKGHHHTSVMLGVTNIEPVDSEASAIERALPVSASETANAPSVLSSEAVTIEEANPNWQGFYTAFLAAVNKQDRAAMVLMMPDGFSDGGGGLTAAEWLQFIDEKAEKGSWKDLQRSFAQGTVIDRDWSSEGKPTRVTRDNGYYFEFRKNNGWYFAGVVGD